MLVSRRPSKLTTVSSGKLVSSSSGERFNAASVVVRSAWATRRWRRRGRGVGHTLLKQISGRAEWSQNQLMKA